MLRQLIIIKWRNLWLFDLIAKLYGPFFDLHNWETVISSGNDWLIIFSLVVIECLLSVDNAVVLAAQTQVLPTKKWQEESLFYGMWGAYIFRFLIIGVGVYLIKFWIIKVLGAAYLFYLAFSFFYNMHQNRHKKSHTHQVKPNKKNHTRRYFWWVVAQIEFMDIIFSIDSVLASLAISPNPVIVLIGGMIGILAMRGVAEVIMMLMKKISELQPMAYFLIIIIALKLFLSIPMIDIEIPAGWFGILVIVTIGVTLIIHLINVRRGKYDDSGSKSE